MAKRRRRRKHKKNRSKDPSSRPTTRAGRRLLRRSGDWPLLECLITKTWKKPGEIVQIAVARRAKTGEVAVAGYLVDLGCLGIKNALANLYRSKRDYKREYRSSLTKSQKMVKCDLDLAAKVIERAVEYADSLGFKPHRDIRYANRVLGEAHPENCDEEIPVGGEDGQPFFIAGPYDDVDRIIRTLNRSVGEGNYNYFVPVGDPSMFGDDIDFLIDGDD
jgi:hypothetical protein